MKKLTILTSSFQPPQITEGDVGFYWFNAVDSVVAQKYPDALSLNRLLLTGVESTHERACKMAVRLLYNEPIFRKIAQLTIFKETVALELHKAFRIINLHHLLIERGYSNCEFVSSSWLADGLIDLLKLIDSPLKVKAPSTPGLNQLRRVYRRLLENRFSMRTIYDEFMHVVNRLDKFHARDRLRRINQTPPKKHKAWVYSTAANYTKICLNYEPYFPEPFEYIVESKLTGGHPLLRAQRPFELIYSFAESHFVPTSYETTIAQEAIYAHLNIDAFSGEEKQAQQLFLQSTWLGNFFTQLLPMGLYLSTLFDRWFTQTEPSALVVGNHCFEGYATYQAKAHQVPSILLQHGLLGIDYPHFDYTVDHFCVRGQFWHDLLSPASRRRAAILNLPFTSIKPSTLPDTNKYIVFATTPEQIVSMPIETHLHETLATILTALHQTDVALMIRVHPLEKISRYQTLINTLLEHTASSVTVQYSQGGDEQTCIASAVAVIMYTSTLFLECIKFQIPIISFDWVHYGFMERLKQYDIFYYAKNLAHLKHFIMQAIKGKLPAKVADTNFFLDNTGAQNLKQQLKKFIDQKTESL